MALTPREKIVMQLYMVEGKSFAEVRRYLNRPIAGQKRRLQINVDQLRYIMRKTARKCLFYNDYWEQRANRALDCKARVAANPIVRGPASDPVSKSDDSS